ncbi:leucine--tRNA ligase [Candidatus Micrarchaeota archaeon]|nr:leucine--tRNA ligase [Candidatus Micrarchaeota archaeon]
MVDLETDWNHLEVQKKWQARWAEAKPFEPSVEPLRRKFFFTVPYPYVSGLLHVGHGRTYTNGDVMARYKRMAGFNVLWPMAFHITGTPVLAVSAKIAARDEQTWGMFREYVSVYEPDASKADQIVESFGDPWNLVRYFSKKLVLDFASMGYSLDLSRQFTTGDPEYNKFIEWQFGKFKEKGFVRQASYPLLYCVNDRNAVGEDDIRDADTSAVELQKFVAVKFALKGGGGESFIVSSTLRPDTVFGITNMFVNPSAEYVRAFVTLPDGRREQWMVSAKAAEKIGLQGKKVEILERFAGERLVGKEIEDPTGKRIPILPASFVDPDHASGFVHSVPGHAPLDYAAIEELRRDSKTLEKFASVGLKQLVDSIVPIAVIEVPGFGQFPAGELCQRLKVANTRERGKLEKATQELYKKEFYEGKLLPVNGKFAGMPVQQAKAGMAEWLVGQGKADWLYETSRPAVCRCGGEVACAVLSDQWFIDYNSGGWKEKARLALSRMQIHPGIYRKQFEDVFEWLDKRPCARRRGLGTRLPFNHEWIIESLSDSTIYMAFYAVIKNIRKHSLRPSQLTPEFFDFVYLGEGDASKIAGVLGTTPAVLDEVRSEFLYWYPNDLRHTGVAHVTNHLSFFIFAHAAIFSPEHWPKGISLNELVVSEGSKMSKSKGNVVLLNKISGAGGADVFRLYAAGSADFGSVLDYRAREVESTRKALNKYIASILKLVELKKTASASNNKPGTQNSSASQWFLSKFESAIAQGTRALEELRLRDYIQTAFYAMQNDFDYFVRRASAQEIASVAPLVADRWIALLAPVIPHTCEELWEISVGEGFAGLAPWPACDAKKIDPKLEIQEDLVVGVIADARKIESLLRRKPKKVSVIVASKEKRDKLAETIAQNDSLETALAKTPDIVMKAYLEKEFYSLKSRGMNEIDEAAVLAAASQFISKELACEVAVEREEASANERKAKAMPLRPAIVLE